MGDEIELIEMFGESDESPPGAQEYMEVLEKSEEYSRMAEDYEVKSKDPEPGVTLTNHSE